MRRWLRWNLHCRRGRRCANLTAEIVANEGDVYGIPPAGFVFAVRYTCGGCGTRYLTRVESLGDGNAFPYPRERVRA